MCLSADKQLSGTATTNTKKKSGGTTLRPPNDCYKEHLCRPAGHSRVLVLAVCRLPVVGVRYHRHLDIGRPCGFQGILVAGVRVPGDADSGIVGQDALDPRTHLGCPVCDKHLARVQRVPDPDPRRRDGTTPSLRPKPC